MKIPNVKFLNEISALRDFKRVQPSQLEVVKYIEKIELENEKMREQLKLEQEQFKNIKVFSKDCKLSHICARHEERIKGLLESFTS